ncbi:hypothetical protein RV134_390203 [Roseovarius sp. EC-HK134]|nr:hypothetical protein RV420_470022 [Roseovarius sp. EC-SD190]VVT33684.1 hypothetical protein RV134_390203 [Roseovarius sp. EC-HK134]
MAGFCRFGCPRLQFDGNVWDKFEESGLFHVISRITFDIWARVMGDSLLK